VIQRSAIGKGKWWANLASFDMYYYFSIYFKHSDLYMALKRRRLGLPHVMPLRPTLVTGAEYNYISRMEYQIISDSTLVPTAFSYDIPFVTLKAVALGFLVARVEKNRWLSAEQKAKRIEEFLYLNLNDLICFWYYFFASVFFGAFKRSDLVSGSIFNIVLSW
jgi:hypothetical protein